MQPRGKENFSVNSLAFLKLYHSSLNKNYRAGNSKDPFSTEKLKIQAKKGSETALLKFWKIFKNLQQPNEYSSKKKKKGKQNMVGEPCDILAYLLHITFAQIASAQKHFKDSRPYS